METMSIDTAAEGLAFLLASKMKLTDFAKGAELDLLNCEIAQLQKERQIIYGAGSKQDFKRVMEKIENVYAPLIRNAITRSNRSEHLSAA
jgi:hypothetical protein